MLARTDAQRVANDIHRRVGIDRRLGQPGEWINQDGSVKLEPLVFERLDEALSLPIRPARVLHLAEYGRPAMAIRADAVGRGTAGLISADVNFAGRGSRGCADLAVLREPGGL